MSIRYECVADVGLDGQILLPADVAGRLRAKGLDRVRVVLTSMADLDQALALRGISPQVVDQVAATQHLDRDLACIVLDGEGAARNHPALHQRLLTMCARSGDE